jgi:Kdo2-lipid IVA lauroyltransferase/acyltransferase
MVGLNWWAPFAFLFSLLPIRVLHAFSSFAAWLLYHVIGYRKNVVHDNLRLAFPSFSEREIAKTARAFYLNLTDVMIEFIKGLSISEKELKKRVLLKNPEIFENFQQKNEGVMVVMGHYTNFEWVALAMPLLVSSPCFAVYGRIKNPTVNHWVVNLRERFGLKLFGMKDTYNFMLTNPAQAPLYLFMADQAPHKGKIRYRAPFFNIPTPTHLGAENLAKKCKLNVVFLRAKREKRGYYSIEAEIITTNAPNDPPYYITNTHVAHLENLIREEAAHWLWSHKRWKNL